MGRAPNVFHDSNHFYFHAVKVFLEAKVTLSNQLTFKQLYVCHKMSLFASFQLKGICI